MIAYDSYTGTITVIANDTDIDPSPLLKNIDFEKWIDISSMKQDLITPTIKEEKRIEKRTDQTYTDILELFAEHQEQSEAEEEQINNLSIKYFLEGDIK